MPPGRWRAEKPAREVILGNEGATADTPPEEYVQIHNEKVRNRNPIQKRPDGEHLGPAAAAISPRFNSDRI